MIFTYAEGTPLEGQQYLIEGTLAAGPFQRNGANGLARAIEGEVGIGANLVTVTNITTTSADVVVEGNVIGTLSDGFPATPANNRVARHFRYLMQLFSGDTRTAVLFAVWMITRYVRHKWGGSLTKAQWTGLVGACWDASETDGVDGE